MAASKPPVRRMTRLVASMVLCALVTGGILVGIWFAAPGLLARKAARRVTEANGIMLVDKTPVTGTVELFETNTHSHHVTQRQVRMAFRGAAGTLESQLGRPPAVVIVADIAGIKWLTAYWEDASGYVELATGSAVNGDETRLRAVAGSRRTNPTETPARLDDLSGIYTR